jgi:hypothetical protein
VTWNRVELEKQTRFGAIKSKIHPTMHFEARRCNQKQAIDYCKKDMNWEEKGNRRIQEERTDLKLIRESLKSSVPIKEMIEQEQMMPCHVPYVRFCQAYLCPEKRNKPKVYRAYGSTGTGKTTWADETFKDSYVKDETQWWDEYDNEETVIFDEFRSNTMPFNKLLKITDKLPYSCQVKGGYMWLRCKNIVFTSNKHPKDIYNKSDEDIKQLLRRIDRIINFDVPVDYASRSEVG